MFSTWMFRDFRWVPRILETEIVCVESVQVKLKYEKQNKVEKRVTPENTFATEIFQDFSNKVTMFSIYTHIYYVRRVSITHISN